MTVPEVWGSRKVDTRTSVSVVIPLREANDARRLVLGARTLGAAGVLCELVVITHGSSNATHERVGGLAEFIDVYERMPLAGTAQAVHQGVARALGEVVVVLDPDVAHDPADYFRVLKPILSGNADVVVGVCSDERAVHSATKPKGLANQARKTCGHWAFRAEVLAGMDLDGRVGIDSLLPRLAVREWRTQQVVLSHVGTRSRELVPQYH
jgi:hypothetical protein